MIKKTKSVRKKANAFYIISTKELAEKDEFKIGIHSGTQKSLLSRYATYLIKPVIYHYIEHNECELIESKIKEKLSEFRIKNHRGTKSEWFNCKLDKLITKAKTIIGSIDNADDTNLNEGKIDIITRFKCENCNYQTNNITNYNNHINRKFPCNPNRNHANREFISISSLPYLLICLCVTIIFMY